MAITFSGNEVEVDGFVIYRDSEKVIVDAGDRPVTLNRDGSIEIGAVKS